MMRGTWIMAGVVAVALLSAAAVQAALTDLEYQGSFSVASGHYGDALVYVPDGAGSNDRPTPVTGPTIITTGSHSSTDYVKEFKLDVALVKTGAPNAATQVPPGGALGQGGTYVDNLGELASDFGISSGCLMNEVIWGYKGRDQSGPRGMGLIKLGTNESWSTGPPKLTGITRHQPYGKPVPNAEYTGEGTATKWDETDTIIGAPWGYQEPDPGVDEGWRVYVSKYVQGAGGAGGDPHVYSWTCTGIFDFYVQSPDGNNYGSPYDRMRNHNLEYVQFQGKKYYVLANILNQAESAKMMFFDAATAGSDATPALTIDVESDISGGVGWFMATSAIADLTYDGDKTLYMLDTGGGGNGGYVHVFRMVPEPATVGLLSLGFLGLAALRRRRRR